jgi:hypothetical protein
MGAAIFSSLTILAAERIRDAYASSVFESCIVNGESLDPLVGCDVRQTHRGKTGANRYNIGANYRSTAGTGGAQMQNKIL